MKHLSKMTEQELNSLAVQAIFEHNYKLLTQIDEYLFPLQDKRIYKEAIENCVKHRKKTK